tara:strand:+ start:17556 stop:18377 length:822 start_codon:yes stop_codon:yes gene_type:complete
MVTVHDGLITDSLSKSVYDYCQTISWYQQWIGFKHLQNDPKRSFQEYIPATDGKTSGRHFLDKDLGPMGVLSLLEFSMYRHPFGRNAEDLKGHPAIEELWNTINRKVFDGKASPDGIQENCAGLSGNRKGYKDSKTFYEKYGFDGDNGFTIMLNARCAEPISSQSIGNRVGQLHKDTDPNISPEDNSWFTVLYIANREWHPDWGGDFYYYGNEHTGAKHWKHGYDIGWASDIVSNKPGRVIVYPHTQTHRTSPPNVMAPEMTQRIAFRVRVTK